MDKNTWVIDGEAAMVALGETLGRILAAQPRAATLFFHGDLGAGKTTLSRGILRGFGHRGAVKSPTYTLVEVYEFDARNVFHFDLYRLGNAEELEYMGIRDYFTASDICLLEWPERGDGFLPKPDLDIDVAVSGAGRSISVAAMSPVGSQLLQALRQAAIQ